ncbi:MAG: M23 family metallopeptidase [Proteobacteria bacterium]|nr:M23 family metallopeptidase [Pseudomonadota bacterium]
MKPRPPQTNKKTKWLILFIIVIVIIPLAGIFFLRFESTTPVVHLDIPQTPVGASFWIKGAITDNKTGLKKIWMGLLQDGKEETVLMDEDYPAGPVYKGGKLLHKEIDILVEPKHLGLKDGTVTLRIVVIDFSWRNWGSGNKIYTEKLLTIDTTPPEIDMLSKTHNVTQGGSGLAIYRVNEKDTKNGVYVQDKFYPGYSGYFGDDTIYLCFFSVAPDQDRNMSIYVSASDAADNKARAGFSYYIRKRNYKKDQIIVSDQFLNWKMPEFDTTEFGVPEESGIDKFLAVNEKLRKKNAQQITAPGAHPEKKMYWVGSFGRLPQSATRATFADYRSYTYKEKTVDHQFHMGIDLASIKGSEVPAANSGKVALTENIGIYGKTVVLDHGFGLFSVYSHLSQIDTSPGSLVAKDEILGRTGTTGLAVGDHLHFSMFVHDTFVNPIEWWDAEWIKNNITSKLEDVKNLTKNVQ